MVRVLVVDNYDSFVYNLVQYIGQLGAEPVVYRNDALDVAGAERLRPAGLLISPGPGRPEDAGASLEMIDHFGPRLPVLGVCLGHQCIGQLYGGRVVRHAVMHGKASRLEHDGRGVFEGLPDPLVAARYHSLVVEAGSVPDQLEITASADDGTVMGLRHRDFQVEGVQFHPESVLTEGGHRMLANWLARCGLAGAVERAAALEQAVALPGA